MNKLLIVIRSLIMIALGLIVGHSAIHANTNTLAESVYKAPTTAVSDQLIKSRLENLSGVIDINYTPEVGKRIREYTVNWRVAGERILGRVDLFFPLFEQEIYKRNLPEELKYIAVVESNLDPLAYSHAGAVGLWQFIKSTGRMKGLKIDNYIDERKDPAKSTSAALDYLTDLYEKFGDWTLAIAAYNCGPGNVRKAIRRANSTDFWVIRRFLPNETQKYVPRIIAAMYLMQYYHAHDLVPAIVDEDIKYVTRIQDGKAHNFKDLSQSLGVSYQTIRALNPQFKTIYFPKNDGHLNLVIPSSKYEKYLELYNPTGYQQLLGELRLIEHLNKEQARMIDIRQNKIKQLQPLKSILSQAIIPQKWRRDVDIVFQSIET